MIRRALLAAALAAPALALVPTAPASAGCTDEYVDAMTSGNDYTFRMPQPSDWASVDPNTLQVTVNGGVLVNDVVGVALIPVVIATTEANYTINAAPGATNTFVNCI